MDSCSFSVAVDGRYALLTVVGDLDLGSLPELVATLTLLASQDVDVVGLDAGAATYVGCCCLRAIDDLRRLLAADGRRFELVAASPVFGAIADCAHYRELVAPGPGVAARGASGRR